MDGDTAVITPAQSLPRGRKAFTLVEMIIVMGLSVLIVSAFVVVSVRMVQDRELESASSMLVSYLRSASERAILSEGGARHGVSRADGRLTLFRGDSYASRTQSYDIVFEHAGNISFSGLTEVVFSQQSGMPSATGDFVLTNGYRTKTVRVYQTGAVSGI